MPSSADLPDLEIELGSPALQTYSLPTELWGGKETLNTSKKINRHKSNTKQDIDRKKSWSLMIFQFSESSCLVFQLLFLPLASRRCLCAYLMCEKEMG